MSSNEATCPACGHFGQHEWMGRWGRTETRSGQEGKCEVFQRWGELRCSECEHRFAQLELETKEDFERVNSRTTAGTDAVI